MRRLEIERRVEIVEQPDQPYKWIAIDQGTGQSLLRLYDLHQLRDVCHRLGWRVVAVKRARMLIRRGLPNDPERKTPPKRG